MPVNTNFPSLKFAARATSSWATGTSNIGFVMVNPFAFAFNGTSDYFNPGGSTHFVSAGLQYSSLSGAFGGTTFSTQQYGGTIAGIATVGSNSQYSLATVGGNCQVRIVGCGIRVRNVTPFMFRGGNLYGLESLNHEDIAGAGNSGLGAYSVAGVNTFDTTGVCSASSEQWHSVVWHPQDEDEFDFVSVHAPGYVLSFNQDDAIAYNSTLGFIAVAPPGQPQTYEYEVWGIYEAKGSITRGLTPSMSDPLGMAVVQNLTASVEARKPHSGSRLALLAGYLGQAAGYANTAYRAYSAVRNVHMSKGINIEEVD